MSRGPVHEQVSISELSWWDLDEIADHDAAIFGPTAWTLTYYWAVRAQAGTVMFAARTATSALAGWIVMSTAGGEADVMTIATTEAGRGRGIGRRLLQAGIDWALSRGAEVVHLEVDEHNDSALGLYRSFGFSEWGRRPDYYPGADAILMRYRP
ncbi:MAG: GNAT family N-acetyltransferase [Brevibacterium sp.]|uniref:GNAT family N-acetyltransferase n=1 Tax=Brevibacterium sp. TaxID=1701 RepID=UPI002648865A|nr:GNAT family N-acetyltransferase [Brevibacterium sp.]MDN5805894.1 GNAT family N-acetyltransferase [Brevibacterium sp.]MDN5832987.1 GNAT family N-acetyltransferase [Brevibacterium sp.]MDN5876981.1 GNAT family N-acetyltransferase [Brevibacterium sp.]MDN5910279.1 GNAT family N-acetyltransferase [Brevibacterium sp.]MDN6122572.1 GNAT family N-acetyltransferase [Brevibacterium sp.]